MCTYLFQNPQTLEIKEVAQAMAEPHIYSTNGVVWDRIFTAPGASADTRINPLDSKDFARKTGNKKGTMGNLFDASAELSAKREEIIGKDPVKEKFWQDWSEKRGGRKPPIQDQNKIIHILAPKG